MSEQLVLGHMPEPIVRPKDTRSARRRLTEKQKALISAGIHPATKRPLRDPVGEKKCKDCSHCDRHDYKTRSYFKCDLVLVSHGMGTDIRLKWPACIKFEQAPDKT